MKEKLDSYAVDQLPGGRYWNPDKQVRDTLYKFPPSNDVCESILGFNDYLTTVVPNLHLMSRSNLMQLLGFHSFQMKNKQQLLTWQ